MNKQVSLCSADGIVQMASHTTSPRLTNPQRSLGDIHQEMLSCCHTAVHAASDFFRIWRSSGLSAK